MNSISESLSKTITVSRFPLIFLIVLLHTIVLEQSYPNGIQIPIGQYPILDVVQFVSQREIGDLGVPAFFLVSGFLFFCGKEMNTDVWKGKLKKRVRSLLIPYVIWNTLFLLYYLALSHFMPVSDWGLSEGTPVKYADLYLGFNDGPVLAPLWFVRDLMILNILSLPVFYIIKTIKWATVPILVLPFLLVDNTTYTLSYVGIRSIVPYFLGACFAICNKEFVVSDKKHLLLLNSVFVLLVICVTILHFSDIHHRALQQTEILVGIFVLLSDIHWLVKNHNATIGKRLAESSFFVFVAHMFVMNIPNKLWVLVFPVDGITASIMQWLIPLVVSMLLYWVYMGLKRLAPKMTSVLIGGR